MCGWDGCGDFFVGEFAAVASVRVGCGYGDGGELIVGVLQAGVRELDGLGCFSGADAGGDVFAGDVLVALLVMVPPIRLSLRWWSWWAM